MNRPLRERTNPQLSVNQMALYLEASARKRRTIIHDNKYPDGPTVIYYKEAADAITTFLGDDFDPDHLEDARQILVETEPSNPQHRTRLRSCIQAINSFTELWDSRLETMLSSLGVYAAQHNATSGNVMREGVVISLRPELYVKGQDRKKNRTKGLIKLYFGKNAPLGQQTAGAIGALCMEHLDSKTKPAGLTHKKHIFIIDVFAQEIFNAPIAIANINSDINACCNEIATIWPTIVRRR